MIDKQSILEYLSIGHILDDKTFVKDKKFEYKHVQPLEYKEWTDGIIKPKLKDIKEHLEFYFQNYRNKKVGVFLSGGKDSRLIMEICNNVGIDTTGITVAYQPDSKENKIAQRICKKLNVNFCYMPINLNMYTIPHMKNTLSYSRKDPSAMPSYNYTFYSGLLKRFDVVFNGSYLTDTKREQRFYRTGNIKTNSDNIIKKEYRINKEYSGDINEQCVQYINDYFIKFVDCCKDIFNLEIPILNQELLNVMWSIPEEDIVLKLLKKFYPTTYNIPRSETPFPIGYPWQIHYGYRIFRNSIRDKMKNLDGGKPSYVDSGAWCNYEDTYFKTMKEIIHVLRGLLPEYDFIDQKIMYEKINNLNNRDNIPTVRRLINVILLEEMNYT